ncbi:hypothetical protein VPNG_05773 [Cytospora leucostoma]|uniref:Uncharacterized protein n=1 Tax=Cytospora leucostoma TaxID=1230097 RepID=A0A423X088_9PEZI|nr:hypothetical protein VPNG_05773 [Cytospora leucostoma]
MRDFGAEGDDEFVADDNDDSLRRRKQTYEFSLYPPTTGAASNPQDKEMPEGDGETLTESEAFISDDELCTSMRNRRT